MLDTESFKNTVVFQAWNALTAAQANVELRAQIQAIQNECSRLAGVLDEREAELRVVRAERDAAMAKLRDIADAAARTMLAAAKTPAGPQDEPISEGGTPD